MRNAHGRHHGRVPVAAGHRAAPGCGGASGRATVVAHGTLTQFQGMNYILLASFTTDAKPQDKSSMK